jgi:uncharacterized membrane protein
VVSQGCIEDSESKIGVINQNSEKKPNSIKKGVVDVSEYVQIASLGKYEIRRLKFVLFRMKSDKVVIIHSDLSEENAQQIQKEIGGELSVSLQKVDPWNYGEILATALNVAYENRKHRLSFNASLGTRVMTAALLMAGAYSKSPVYLVKEIENQASGIIELQPLKRMMLTTPKKNILKLIIKHKDKQILQKHLPSRASLSASTISGHVGELEQAGYIEKSSTRDGNMLSITNLGQIVLRAARYWKEEK